MEKMIMKIVLINLPSPFLDDPAMNPPLGLCSIGAYVKSRGHQDVTLVDFNLLNDKYQFSDRSDYLKEIPLDADMYGISCMTPQYRWLCDVTQYIKTNNPDAMVVSGGAHSSNLPEDCLECGVDVAILGEGEIPFYMLVDGNKANQVPGAATLNNFKNVQPYRTPNIDDLPFPDRDLVELKKYKRLLMHEAERGEDAEISRAVHITTMRGCPFNCAFCDRNSVGRIVRFRSVEKVIEEVDMIRDKYGINAFVIYDDTFTVNKKRVFKFCEEFAKRGSKWRTWARVNTVNEEMLQAMKDSGCIKLLFGYESGDDRILKIINKKTTRKQNIESANMCRKVGIQCYATLIYGLPGENKESIDNTISMIKEAQPDELHYHVLTPMPGSPIWNDPQKYGIEINKHDLKNKYYYSLSCCTNSIAGVGNIYYKHDSMTTEEYINNLKYFTEGLKNVAPDSVYQRIEDDKLEDDLRLI
jgi:radical SAM superfamily enzyme YgiQ (UPF0313 family)